MEVEREAPISEWERRCIKVWRGREVLVELVVGAR